MKQKKFFNDDNEKLHKCIQSQNETEKEIDATKILYASCNTLSLDADSSMTFSFQKHPEEINSSFSMYSPTFKTSPYGYAFVFRVCATMESTNEKKERIFIDLSYITS